MPGTIHQAAGQEACAVGVCSALRDGDVITSTHRPHEHAVARGLPVNSLMAELLEGHVRSHVLNGKLKPTSQQLVAADEVIDMVKSYLR